MVERLGPGSLSRPTAIVLGFGAVAGVAVAIAVKPPPMPTRFANVKGFVSAHLGWSFGAIALASVSCSVGALESDGAVSLLATTRNVLICSGIAMVLVAVGPLWVAWLGPFAYMLAAMQFGSPNGSTVATWAVVIEPESRYSHVGVAGLVALCAWVILIIRSLAFAGLGPLRTRS